MNPRNVAIAFAVAAAAALAGCEDKCPTETPESSVQSCTAGAGQPVTVRVQPCEKCNQTGTTCQVDVQGTDIQLDLTAEACDSGASCPIQCNIASPITCTFAAPGPGTYDVRLYDPTQNSFEIVAELTVTEGGVPSCALIPTLQ